MATPGPPPPRTPASPHDHMISRRGGRPPLEVRGRSQRTLQMQAGETKWPPNSEPPSCFPVSWRPSSGSVAADSQAECLVLWNLSGGPQPGILPMALLGLPRAGGPLLPPPLPKPAGLRLCWGSSKPYTSPLHSGLCVPPVPCTSFSEDSRHSYYVLGPGNSTQDCTYPLVACGVGLDGPRSADEGLRKVRQPPSPE